MLTERLVPYQRLDTHTEQLLSALEVDPWAPSLPENLPFGNLSNELVSELLSYFVTCGQRLSQMTKTYDDTDVVIKLLQEKQIDLELAARLGQDLLRQNTKLKLSIAGLKEELKKAIDSSAAAMLCHSLNASLWKSFPNSFLSNKVQLVKRMEGSRHLDKWKKLASPDLNSIVQTKSQESLSPKSFSFINDEVD